jgi:FPC/CPF motif-containing protein YcgG
VNVTREGGNPHRSEDAISASAYARFEGERLISRDGDDAAALAERVHAALRALILDPEFPCVGARSAFNQGSYRFAMYDEMSTEATTGGLARDLYTFVQEQPSIEGQFTTFVAVFDAPKVKEGIEFERLLWDQLARLHALDTESWDHAVSSDPADPRFSFSFAGRAFFVVGLAPSGERWARTFPWPVMAFNSHDQFEALRASGQFERMQEVIRERDTELEGDVNPNLSNFGEHTEARQYSGREVGPDWRCPVTFTRAGGGAT